ncbi:protein trichome birefringence-like 24 isoform X2 [Andrographis paniculata]|uniref:protein trichome birefringence-like 24 isoform X2 n=1 Tax=Andrographis paniculata TaxID=175694 RepID=UPI0021E8DF06|nr:protein trichome birefringence-like 24 isoform X2 [Andrographis paniculata]
MNVSARHSLRYQTNPPLQQSTPRLHYGNNSNRNNEEPPAAGLNITDSQTLIPSPPPPPPPPPPPTNDDSRNVSAKKCDLFKGDWIPDPDGPLYTNFTCDVIDGPQNCIRNGRPDLHYIYWRWKPRDCDLPRFDPIKFLKMMRHKSLAFAGDSIMRNHVQSLLCMLSQIEQPVDVYHDEQYKNRRWNFPTYSFNVSLLWSPFLTKAVTFEDDNGAATAPDMIRIHLDVTDDVWAEQYEDHDYVVIAGGKWFLKSALYYVNRTLIGCHNCHNPNITQLGFRYAYRKALNTTLRFIVEKARGRARTVAVFRSLAPDHFENGEWNTGGYCNRTRPFKTGEVEINETDQVMRRAELEEFERARAAAAAAEETVKLKLFDVTYMSLLRPDGHPGAYRREPPYDPATEDSINDCLHWCLPGPIDSWNELLVMEILLQGTSGDDEY